MINTNNLAELRKQIEKNKKEEKIIVVKAQDEEFNRKVLENKEVDVLFSPEFHDRKDGFKKRDSGLNEYLCKLAKQNNIIIAIDLDQLKILPKRDKAMVLARIMQNIDLCKRTKTLIKIYSETKYSPINLSSLFLTLKSSTEQAKNAYFS
jgi:RNase P/RNase MRP subunit p30